MKILPSEYKKNKQTNRDIIFFLILFLFALSLIASIGDKITYGTEFEDYEYIYAEVTAYNADIAQTDDRPREMASGKEVYDGAIACPIYLALGDKVVIEKKIYTCEDRMAQRFRNSHHYDIFMEDKDEALTFGRQPLLVTILN